MTRPRSPHRPPASLALAAFVLLTIAADSARAIPYFARKYGQNCFACHSVDFSVNEYGRAFDGAGYQIPGTVERTPVWAGGPMPLSFVVSTRVGFGKAQADSTNRLMFPSIRADLLSGGTLAGHLSYYAELEFLEFGGEIRPELEIVQVNFNHLDGNPLGTMNLRAGRFRVEMPFELLLEQSSLATTTTPYHSSYLAYSYSPIYSSARPYYAALREPRYGVSLNGALPRLGNAAYEVAFLGPDVGVLNTLDAFSYFAHFAPSIPIPGLPIDFGLTYVGGTQRADPGAISVKIDNAFYGYGPDASIADPFGGALRLYGQYMHYHSSDMEPSPRAQPRDADGFFIGSEYVVMPEELGAFARYDALEVTSHSDVDRTTLQAQYSVGMRYYLAPNAHLIIEAFKTHTKTTGTPASDAFYLTVGAFIGL